MLRKKLKKIIAIALASLTIFSCGYFMNNKTNQEQTSNQYKNLSYKISNTNVQTEKIKVEDIQSIGELSFMQSSINHTVTLEQGWKCFSKCKTINFKCIGKYSIDFSKINSNNIHISGQDIKIYCKKPNIDIMFLHDKTTYEDNNGCLATNMKLDPEDIVKIEEQSTKDILNKISTDDYMNDAKILAEKNLTNILLKFGVKYDITINWID